ncbi:MAG: hypothetical protein HY444_02590 [Nitrospirae bacterium]|nr:hypothetical protein [Nitrospirota bacterium]
MAGVGCQWPWGAASRFRWSGEASGQQYDCLWLEEINASMPPPEQFALRQPWLSVRSEKRLATFFPLR